MKNVLFTTTALAAMALSSAAFAGAHASGNFGLSGKSVVGYNDDEEDGLFFDTDVNIKANGEIAPGYTATANYNVSVDINETGGDTAVGATFDGATLATPFGTLSWDDNMEDVTAADEWYSDRDGMDIDVPSGEDDSGIKWVGDIGDFGYAVSTGGDDGDKDIPSNFNFGAGGEFGDISVGFGYAEGAGAADDVIGVSADFDIGDFGVGVSFADGAETSIGLVGDATFGDVGVNAYYAINDNSDDKYGVGVDFASGPFSIGIDFDTGAGQVNDSIEIDVEYAVNDDITFYAGLDDAEAGDGLYAGVVAEVTDGVTATIAYSDFEESGDPEFKQGTSAYLTVKY